MFTRYLYITLFAGLACPFREMLELLSGDGVFFAALGHDRVAQGWQRANLGSQIVVKAALARGKPLADQGNSAAAHAQPTKSVFDEPDTPRVRETDKGRQTRKTAPEK